MLAGKSLPVKPYLRISPVTGYVRPVSSIHERIRELRIARGLTQEALAREAGTTYVNIRNWERRKITPGIEFVPRLAEALGVSAGELLTGHEQPYDVKTIAAMMAGIEPLELVAARLLKKPRLSAADRSELEDALYGADAARRMLGLDRSVELDAAVTRRIAALRAQRESAETPKTDSDQRPAGPDDLGDELSERASEKAKRKRRPGR